MILEPHLLRSLVEVADAGTVTAAAASLGYSPSAISQHLAKLEARLGIPLLEPNGRNLALTAAGAALLEAAPRVFSALDDASAAAHQAAGVVGGAVRLGTFQSAAVQLLPPAIASLRDLYPDIDVEVLQQPTDKSLRQLQTTSLDVVLDQDFETSPIRASSATTVLMRDPLVLVSPRSDRAPTSLADVSNHTWICPKPETSSCAAFVLELCDRHGFRPNVKWWVEDYLLLLNLVAVGAGVGIVSRATARHVNAPVHTTPLPPDAERTIVAHTRPGRISPAATALLDALRREGAEQDRQLGKSVNYAA